MKREIGFLESLRISIFDFKSYSKFIDIGFFKIFLNRVLFVFIISLFYIVFLNKDMKILNEFNRTKHEIFKDISYSNGILNIENSPTMFSYDDFLFIGDTRDQVNFSEFNNYYDYRRSIVLLKDSFVFKNGLKELKVKYSDILIQNIISNNYQIINKDMIFSLIDSVSNTFKYVMFLIFPIFMIFNYFFLAFLTSFFAYVCSIILRVKIKFIQVYKLILFSQGIPFLIISIFEVIAKFNGINVLFPSHILEFLTLSLFLITMFTVKRESMKKSFNNKK